MGVQRSSALAILALGAAVLWAVTLSRTRTAAPPPVAETPGGPATAEPAGAPRARVTPRPEAPTPAEAPAPTTLQRPPASAPQGARPSAKDEALPSEVGVPPPELNGPVDELKAQFESEPRDSDAYRFEQEIEAAFDHKGVPASLLDVVVCRRSVCRVETRWTPANADGFMLAFTALLMNPEGTRPQLFGSALAIEPQGEPTPDGAQATTVYIRRLE